MMELFVERPVVPRSELVAIFEDDPAFLDKLEAARLVLFLDNPLEAEGLDARTWQAMATAGVPRLLSAWRMLLADAGMQQQRGSVRAAVDKAKAKASVKDAQEQLVSLAAARRDAAAELAMLAQHEAALREAFEGRFEQQRAAAVARLEELWKRSAETEKDLAEAEAALESAKQLKKSLKKQKKAKPSDDDLAAAAATATPPTTTIALPTAATAAAATEPTSTVAAATAAAAEATVTAAAEAVGTAATDTTPAAATAEAAPAESSSTTAASEEAKSEEA